jgi:homoserine O-acetyltransferase
MPEPAPTTATRFFEYKKPFALRAGGSLPGFTLAYETWGEPDPQRSNAILVFHAKTGSQHAAGSNPSVPGLRVQWTDECQAGWWDGFIGPGKAFDTDKYFVICANYLGGCYGSTGPASIDPSTGAPYGSRFPAVEFPDIVESQLLLLDHLGIKKLHAIGGASIGGLMALDLAVRHPQRAGRLALLATGSKVATLQRILNFEQITAIEGDADYLGGDYYPGAGPVRGLCLARMIAHKTFISLETLGIRSRAEVVIPSEHVGNYVLTSPYESYMLHQGKKFPARFDANTYLLIMQAWQRFDLAHAAGCGSVPEALRRCAGLPALLFSIDSDVCFYPEEQAELAMQLREAGVTVEKIPVSSHKGHDSFLLEPELYEAAIKRFLAAP